ncbi:MULTISPECIES: cation:proton antiporter [unclassified Undibacterium]|uniref:cation:proton antiporter domain-containing protein n=1 Tax=unclassified Undibacterium TaxID=2630295 RepID=UPI002AC94094|nr:MULTISPECIES: cation:proton antiporter [unclassified Undibacterium]MEB0140961.1 cation:proton antiporter [Undibacterium sp. CCC2.1]MEB0173973.1 cation:proton antiporter [Undibacterium sp. CCC1.1]MEB0177907.1 cation:proton antiporter [Undibacterium sp. CCC3.4]MEB0217151.1 cation:proton antiporter [Undibacterium sp. 5I2]WPX44386.1 cation:proton antiporter [Undibacterium sp. CCC3.4]
MTALDTTLTLLAAAVFGVVAFRMLQLPPILGYLTVGILIGPFGLRMAEDGVVTHELAEFGVVFLMFSIGLEFSLAKLMAMRRAVFGLGMAQVLTTILMAMAAAWMAAHWLPQYFQISWEASFALGGALSMSSTAIVSKMLTEKLELESPHGRQIISVLLFQDLAVVPLLIMVPALAAHSDDIVQTLAWAGAKAVLVLGILLVGGQKLMRVWFRIVVKRRSQELFMLNLLLITLGAAWLTEKAGLSMALGAFVAGMLISETEYRHQVEEDIKPFRDVLLGLFFITIGMLLNLGVVWNQFGLVLLLFVVPMLMKLLLITGLAKLFGSPTSAALRTGLGLAQAGEFGFVLLNQAGVLHLIDADLLQVILAAMVLSMLASPFILAKSDAIVMKFSANEWMMQSLALTQIAARTMNAKKHVIIAGFGRSGQSLARLLAEENIEYHALDLDPDRVREAQTAGANVSYGDAARRESLKAAGINRAAALVVTYTGTASALKILHFVTEMHPGLPVIIRSHDDSDLDILRAAGATEVVPELMEGSLMLASHALVLLGVPLRRVVHKVQAARDARYASLRGFFHGLGDATDSPENLQIRLHTVVLPERSQAVGKSLAELELGALELDVQALRRGKSHLVPEGMQVLQGGDVLVLRGTSEAVARGEQRLLK